MSNKWRRVGKRDRFLYDDTWSVKRDGAQWYVYRDGIALINAFYMDASAAIQAAEKIAGVA